MGAMYDFENKELVKKISSILEILETKEVLNLKGKGTRAVEGWFLGPKGENAKELEELIVEAIRDQVFWRRNFHPGDPSYITDESKRSLEYVQTMDCLKENYRSLLAFLKKSVPFFSMRYQGHMNWDLTIPGIIGYFAAMLYNSNNVAFEGSTATTILEMLVGDDLCRMLGYKIPSSEEFGRGYVRPWGHITCDGTVANIEAIWASRNLKYYPISIKEALCNEKTLEHARNIEILLPNGKKDIFIKLDTWTLLNLKGDDILALPARLMNEYQLDQDVISEAISKYSVQNLGMQEFSRRFLNDFTNQPVFFVPGTKHYSFPKAAALLGIGASNMIDIHVDEDARMSISHLHETLSNCLAKKIPVYTVIAVMGSTEESAVDPIKDILYLREEFRLKGLEFTIHADAAWGGYHASIIRDDFDLGDPGHKEFVPPPAVFLKNYVAEQFKVLGNADSITVDPHKSGYIPYPAGSLCYRNSLMRDLITFFAPVIYKNAAEPTVGIFGIEGSKPGAAAASVYLSHKVIRPTKNGYGKIIGQALFSCKKLYTRLLCMARPEDPFIVVPVPRLPAEINHTNVEEQINFIRERIVGKSNDEIINDKEVMDLLVELGPDQNILAYAFNFKTSLDTINNDLELANYFNKSIYEMLSIDEGSDIYSYNLIVSSTDLSSVQYGNNFIDNYKKRLGIDLSLGENVTVLRSVVMDPWITDIKNVSFLDIIEQEFRKTILKVLKDMMHTNARGI